MTKLDIGKIWVDPKYKNVLDIYNSFIYECSLVFDDYSDNISYDLSRELEYSKEKVLKQISGLRYLYRLVNSEHILQFGYNSLRETMNRFDELQYDIDSAKAILKVLELSGLIKVYK